jgi:hypothetical protein
MISKTAKWSLVHFYVGEEGMKIVLKSYSLDKLLGGERFDLYPKGQRKSESWSGKKKKRFIKAVMKGEMNLGQIIVRYDTKTKKFSMIDGSHRLSTILLQFRKNKIKWNGKYWKDLEVEKQEQFERNASFVACVYTDITDAEAAEIFAAANDGEDVNEPELYNSTGGPLSDIVRIQTRPWKDRKDSYAPEYCEDILGQHELFKQLDEKWILRHAHELMAVIFIHEAYFHVVRGKTFYESGTANEKSSRQRLYWREDQRNDVKIDGYWDELVKDNPETAKKVLVRAQESMDIMYRFLDVCQPSMTELGQGTKPGKKFWNLFYFVRGLDLEIKKFKIKDYEAFLHMFIILDNKLCDRDDPKINPNGKNSQTPYEQEAGEWQPDDIKKRNELMLRQFYKQGSYNDWGVRAEESKATPKQRRLLYAKQGGRSALSGKKYPLDKMEAHHSLVPGYMNGSNKLDNLCLISINEHRQIHAQT